MGAFWSPAPVVVAGPCVLEHDELNLAVAERLRDLAERLAVKVVFKASFDKANRTTLKGHRGPGLEQGLEALRKVRSATGLPVITDVHEAWQAEQVSSGVDALQVPAFLCRQTDLLTAVGRTGLPVNIKRGQWMPPESMQGAVEKVRAGGSTDIVVTERGTFFGYGDLVVDMRNFSRMRHATGVPVLFDATHSVQRPGRGLDGSSGGERGYVPHLLLAAAGAGADGWFVETHPAPSQAPSDAAVMWPLDALEAVLRRALQIWHIVVGPLEV